MKLCIHVRPRDDGQGWAVDVFDGRRAWSKTHLGEQPLNKAEALFDDAGEGQFNVLNLVESYQRNSMEADERLRAVRKLLEENGCECPCDHHPDERGPDCEVCLACRIGEAVGK